MRKSLVLISSGQDSAAVLYDTLKNTDDEVYARFIRHSLFHSKNDMDFCEKYILNVVEWCKENIRDFDFDIEVAESPNWSFYLSPKDRVYDQLSKEILDKYEGTPITEYSVGGPDFIWARAKVAEKLKVDATLSGRDIIQEYQDICFCYNIEWNDVISQDWKQGDIRHTCDLISFWYDTGIDIPLEAPLAYQYKMSRLSTYDSLPEELKLRINQCNNYKRKPEWYFRSYRWGEDEWCGECIRCLTRSVHETKVYTLEETEQIFNNYFVKNALSIGKQSARYGYNYCLSRMLTALESPEDMEEFRNDFSIEISE